MREGNASLELTPKKKKKRSIRTCWLRGNASYTFVYVGAIT